MSAARLRRTSGVSEQGLLGTRGGDHPHEALWTPGAAQHLYPRVYVRGLDKESHGDGLERESTVKRRTGYSEYYQNLRDLLLR